MFPDTDPNAPDEERQALRRPDDDSTTTTPNSPPEQPALLSTHVSSTAAHTTYDVTLFQILQVVFCLEESRINDTPVKPGTVVLLFSIWTIVMLYVFTGMMGPGVRQILLQEVPMVSFILAVPLMMIYSATQRYWVSTNSRIYYYCCFVFILVCLSIHFTIEGDWFFWESPWLWDCLFLWILIGFFAFIRYIFQTMMRTLHRQTREEDPSVQFWHRIDICLVNLLRCFGVLIFMGYLASVAMVLIIGGFDGPGSLFLTIFLITLSSVSLYYFIGATLMVRDRPASRMEFPTAATTSYINNLRRRTRQFVLNPNDPMGEPLLLV